MEPDLIAKDARLEIQKLNDLPPMPAFAAQFLDAIDDPAVEVRELARILEKDPSLLARIIGLANAAYFGLRQPVTSAEEAIFKVLGIRTTKSLAISIILSGCFDASGTPGFRPGEYWFTSIAAATIARRLAEMVKGDSRPSPAGAYLCGLLHGIGQLALVHLYPAASERVFGSPELPARGITALEREVLGLDHLQVGGWLARKWHLPPMVVAAIEHHGEAAYEGRYWREVRLVGIGKAAAEKLRSEEALELDEGDLGRLGIDAGRAARALEHIEANRAEVAAMAGRLTGG